MVIIYHGKVESVKQDLAKEQYNLNQRYVEVLGEDRAKRVKDIASRILTPESFMDARETYISLYGEPLSENAPCNFSMATLSDLKVRSNGEIKERKVKTSPLFYISDEAFKHSGYSKVTHRILATYIHEYNHFIFYALQNPPVFVANCFLYNYLKPRKKPFDLEDYVQQLSREEIPEQEKMKKLVIASHTSLIEDAYEQATRVLDKSILESTGIEISLPWRGMPRSFKLIQLPIGKIMATGCGGDMYQGLDDKAIIGRFIEWNRYFNQRLAAIKGGIFVRPEEGQYVTNLINSLRELKVSRLPIQDLMELQRRERKRRK